MPWWGWGAIALGIVWAVAMVWILRTTAKPLPRLDTTPRTATVTGITEKNDNDLVIVEYTHGDGEVYTAGLADVIHDSWIGKFAPGTQWQVYAFRSPEPRVILTEAHDDVVRCGYALSGIRLGGESGPVDVGPGSPFLNGARKFAE